MLSDNEITIEKAAQILRTTHEEVERLIKRSLLPSRLHISPDGTRCRLIEREACHRLAESGFPKAPEKESRFEPPVVNEPTPPPRQEHPAKEVIPTSQLTAANWSSTTHQVVDQQATATPPKPEPVERREAALESGILSLIKEVAGVQARLQVLEERIEVTRQIEKELATVGERVRVMEDRTKNLVEHLEAVERLEAAHVREFKDTLNEFRASAQRFQEATENALTSLRQQGTQQEEKLGEQAKSLDSLNSWIEETEGKKPMAQVKRFIADRKGKSEEP